MGCIGAAWYGREDICSQIVAALERCAAGLFSDRLEVVFVGGGDMGLAEKA